MISGKLTLIALGVTGFASSIGSAQVIRDHRSGATLYQVTNFRGSSTRIAASESIPDLGRERGVTVVNSVRVHRGRWLLCSRPSYRGRCVTIDSDVSNLSGMNLPAVGSIRPLPTAPPASSYVMNPGSESVPPYVNRAPAQPASPYVWNPGSESVPPHWERAPAQPESQPETVPGDTSSSGRSLRGGSAEFFVEPMLRGGRLMACSRDVWDTQCISETADSFCREKGWDVAAFDVTESIGKRLYFAEVLCIRRRR